MFRYLLTSCHDIYRCHIVPWMDSLGIIQKLLVFQSRTTFVYCITISKYANGHIGTNFIGKYLIHWFWYQQQQQQQHRCNSGHRSIVWYHNGNIQYRLHIKLSKYSQMFAPCGKIVPLCFLIENYSVSCQHYSVFRIVLSIRIFANILTIKTRLGLCFDLLFHIVWCSSHMMTSSNGNIFRVTGLLCGEYTIYIYNYNYHTYLH